MPWYYAGPEAKPVGPFTLEELQARRQEGAIKPETYIIEQTGGPVDALAWKRYQDVFPPAPAASTLPPVPPASAAYVPPPAPPQPHPLFPSATPGATPPLTVPVAARPDPYYSARRTNGWCMAGGVFGIIAFFSAFLCGFGLFPALLGIVLCAVGLFQVHKHPEQAGQGWAISGLILSIIAIIISLLMFAWLGFPILKAHGLTVTEQTSNDSE
jgi:hypothetical protein